MTDRLQSATLVSPGRESRRDRKRGRHSADAVNRVVSISAASPIPVGSLRDLATVGVDPAHISTQTTETRRR